MVIFMHITIQTWVLLFNVQLSEQDIIKTFMWCDTLIALSNLGGLIVNRSLAPIYQVAYILVA